VSARRRRPGQLPLPAADPGPSEPDRTDEEFAIVIDRVPDKPVSVPDLPDGDRRDAPWDMAGDWGRASRATATDAWGAAQVNDAWGTVPLEESRRRGARARLTGQQPSAQETPVPGGE
jgi:hypothetical protein